MGAAKFMCSGCGEKLVGVVLCLKCENKRIAEKKRIKNFSRVSAQRFKDQDERLKGLSNIQNINR